MAFWGDERWGSKEQRESCSPSPLYLEEEASFYQVDTVGISMYGPWDSVIAHRELGGMGDESLMLKPAPEWPLKSCVKLYACPHMLVRCRM